MSRINMKLKKIVIIAPIKSYPLPKGNFNVGTDSSNLGLGAVLSQIQEEQEKVIGFFSKTLSRPEFLCYQTRTTYCCQRNKAFLQILNLYGWRFLFKYPEGQVARWVERLEQFDFEIKHRVWNSHKNADALLRRPVPKITHIANKQKKKNQGNHCK